jgi:hypothetical protein
MECGSDKYGSYDRSLVMMNRTADKNVDIYGAEGADMHLAL